MSVNDFKEIRSHVCTAVIWNSKKPGRQAESLTNTRASVNNTRRQSPKHAQNNAVILAIIISSHHGPIRRTTASSIQTLGLPNRVTKGRTAPFWQPAFIGASASSFGHA